MSLTPTANSLLKCIFTLSDAMVSLGKPSFKKSAVFFNIVQPMFKNYVGKHPLQNRTNVQINGGGVKGLLNNVQKNCTFLKGWHPLVSWWEIWLFTMLLPISGVHP